MYKLELIKTERMELTLDFTDIVDYLEHTKGKNWSLPVLYYLIKVTTPKGKAIIDFEWGDVHEFYDHCDYSELANIIDKHLESKLTKTTWWGDTMGAEFLRFEFTPGLNDQATVTTFVPHCGELSMILGKDELKKLSSYLHNLFDKYNTPEYDWARSYC